MSNVYKPKGVRKKGTATPSKWGPLVVGVLIGLGIGLVVYLSQTKINRHDHSLAVSDPPVVKKIQKNQSKPQQPAKSQYDFYTLLPEMEVVIPDNDETSDSNENLGKTDKHETYVLQTGSFRRFVEADTLKANLALIGIESKIQTVAINGEDTWYRVRIGPYTDFSQVREARARLKKNDVQFILLKIKLDSAG